VYGVSRDFLCQREPNRPYTRPPHRPTGKTNNRKNRKFITTHVHTIPQRGASNFCALTAANSNKQP
jgi:hypothetical protein